MYQNLREENRSCATSVDVICLDLRSVQRLAFKFFLRRRLKRLEGVSDYINEIFVMLFTRET